MTASEEQPVHVERRGSIGILTIDQLGRVNALSRATLYAQGRLGAELVSDEAVRAIVVTGTGDQAFCAGADLEERRGMTLESVYYDETLRSEDRLEALAAFAEKRKPAVKGK